MASTISSAGCSPERRDVVADAGGGVGQDDEEGTDLVARVGAQALLDLCRIDMPGGVGVEDLDVGTTEFGLFTPHDGEGA